MVAGRHDHDSREQRSILRGLAQSVVPVDKAGTAEYVGFMTRTKYDTEKTPAARGAGRGQRTYVRQTVTYEPRMTRLDRFIEWLEDKRDELREELHRMR
jgi:hypothetical protein